MNKEEIKNLIKDLVEKVNIKLNGISVQEDSPDNVWFKVEVAEPNFFMERNGEALQALNHIIRRIVENKKLVSSETDANRAGGQRILVDINDFQKRKVENIRTVAHMMGERARYFKSNIEIDPMSSFERRVVHEFLSNALDLKTESIGFGPSRRVVIKYIGDL